MRDVWDVSAQIATDIPEFQMLMYDREDNCSWMKSESDDNAPRRWSHYPRTWERRSWSVRTFELKTYLQSCISRHIDKVCCLKQDAYQALSKDDESRSGSG